MNFDTLKIIPNDDPRLHTKCPEVDPKGLGADVGRALESFLFNYNLEQKELQAEGKPYKFGYGIAAPQVGILQRVFVLLNTLSSKSCRIFINPSIAKTYGEKTRPQEFQKPLKGFTEGCLSWNERVDIPRYEKIRVSYQDVRGETISEYMRGLDAIAFQHELDHLDGVNIVDYK